MGTLNHRDALHSSSKSYEGWPMDLTASKLSEAVQGRAHQNSSGQLHHAVEGVRLCTHRVNFVCGVCCASGSRLLFDRCLLVGICPPPESFESHRRSGESGFKTIWGNPPWMCWKNEEEKTYFSSENLNKRNTLPPSIKEESNPSAFKAKAKQQLLDSICQTECGWLNVFMVYLFIHSTIQQFTRLFLFVVWTIF